MKYQSEIIAEIVDKRGHEKSSLHYESECVETWIEEAKGGYPKLCDYEGEWLNYINENPIGDFPYETLTDITDATVNNVVPYAYKSAILKGQTLVNVIDKIWFHSEAKHFFYIDLKQYEVNKDYLFVIFNAPDEITQIYLGNSDTTMMWRNYTTDFIRNGSTVSLKVTCPSNYDGSTNVPLFRFGSSEPSLDEVKQMKAMLIPYQEGMENWDIPYFEGMQSVKMPVLTTVGRNLVDEKNFTKGYITSTGGIDTGSATNSLTDYIRVKPNTSYAYKAFVNGSTAIYGECAYYNKNKNFISRNLKGHSNNECIVTPSDCYYIRFWNPLYVENGNVHPKCMIVETTQLPSTLSKYEPYKSNILTVNEDVTLRGVGDVADELDCLTGEVVERIGEIVLDGSEDWGIPSTDVSNHNTMMFYCRTYSGEQVPGKNTIISDKFPQGDKNKDLELVDNRTGFFCYIRILKERLETQNVSGFKSWLSQNPITVQYESAQESVKTVDLTCVNQNGENIKFKPIEGTMHIATDGTPIKPTFTGEIPVEAITQNLVSFIEE